MKRGRPRELASALLFLPVHEDAKKRGSIKISPRERGCSNDNIVERRWKGGGDRMWKKKRKEGRKEGREKGKKSTLSSANAISCMYNKIIKDRFLEAWRKNRGEKMRKVSSYWIRGFRGVCKKKKNDKSGEKKYNFNSNESLKRFIVSKLNGM